MSEIKESINLPITKNKTTKRSQALINLYLCQINSLIVFVCVCASISIRNKHNTKTFKLQFTNKFIFDNIKVVTNTKTCGS